MPADFEDSSVYAVVRVKDADGAVDIQVGDRRYGGAFLYKPKAVSLRDRLYLRLGAGHASGDLDVAGVVVALDGPSTAPRAPHRSARFTLRVTTVQRDGIDLSSQALATGRLSGGPAKQRPPASAASTARLALPSLEGDAAPTARSTTPTQGTLDVRTMSDLVAQIVRDGRTAAIEVQADLGLGGTVFIEGGEIVAAWAGAARGIEGVLLLSTYVGGMFRVRPGCTTVMRNVEQPAALVLRALANVQRLAVEHPDAAFTDEPTLKELDASMSSSP